MKLQSMTLALLLGMSLALHAQAAPDESQRWATRHAAEAQQKLRAAEAAKGAERQKLMTEHMTMMQEIMKKMDGMKPKSGMSMKEHEEWMEENYKLMQQVMDQMMREHHLLMNAANTGKY